MILGTDYKFRDDLFDMNKEGTTVPIELLLDPFAGVLYCYTVVQFRLGEDNVPRMKFEYEILKSNDLSMMTLRKNKKFNEVLGLILNALILDAEGGMDEAGGNNPKKPDNEGGLHEESSTISETGLLLKP
jgi:hypothetical protein